MQQQPPSHEGSVSSGASRVALGMISSRALGFVREMALAFFFGAGPHADVFRTALRGPNLLQNLLGEQTLSASFIPVYSRLLAAGRQKDAGRFAGAVFGLLLATAGIISLLGVLLAEPIVSVLAPGYLGDTARVAAGTMEVDRFPLAVTTVRIIFPMTGVLVLSAWALGVLNSHRRFFVPYFAPALWNAAIITALWLAARLGSASAGGLRPDQLATEAKNQLLIAACLGALVGGVLQFLVQLPFVCRVLRGFTFSVSRRVEGVAEAWRAFAPLAVGRGAVQLSGYLDFLLASFLAAGAVAALGWAQALYLLPIGLFGMSVAAAELPELARHTGPTERDQLRSRIEAGFRQMAFPTVPTMIGYLAFGHLLVGALFRRGAFGEADNWLVYLVLCGYSLGLVASNSSRQLNNVFFALGHTKPAARVAVERVLLSAAIGAGLMVWLDRFEVGQTVGVETANGGSLYLGAVGLALGAGISSWYELWRLRWSLRRLLEVPALPWGRIVAMFCLAFAATLPSWLVWFFLRSWPQVPLALLVLGLYGATYVVIAKALRWPELDRWVGAFSKNSH